MIFKPVVEYDEPVRIALCPSCKGSEIFCIERFLSEDDQAEIQRYKAAGYLIIKRPLNLATHIHNCECPKKAAGYSVQTSAARTNDASRPILSLKRKAATT